MHNFFLLIIIFFYPFIVRSEILNKIEITGNKRTTKEAIIQHGQIKINQELSKEELEKIKQNLGRINQVHIQSVEFRDGILKIDIFDKWALFPVPMITQSGNYYNRGVLIYDDNFLGTLGTLAPGISWSNSHLNYVLYYQDEAVVNPYFGIKVLLIKKSELVEFKRNNIFVSNFESLYKSYLIAPNYLYEGHVFKGGPIYIDKVIYKNNLKVSQNKSIGLFFRHHWNAFQAMEVMYKGFVTTFDLYSLKSQIGKMVFLNEANVAWSIPVKNSFLNFRAHGYYSNEKSYLFSKNLGGDEGYRGYDKASLPITKNAGGLVQFQQHLFKSFFLSPFYEFNSSKLANLIQEDKSLNESTFGIGFRYYFKKISIPAVILDFGRNINDKSNHFHLNIGANI